MAGWGGRGSKAYKAKKAGAARSFRNKARTVNIIRGRA
jgi:hypothetical protein